MKSIQTNIDGLGAVELREPTVAQIRPFLSLMGKDTQAFMVAVIDLIVFKDGKHVPKVTHNIGLSVLLDLIPQLTELLGFDKAEPADDSGND